MFEILTSHEPERGCGYRKPGGLYLVSEAPGVGCGKLPAELVCCPTCGGGIKPARGWTWVNGTALLAELPCSSSSTYCAHCPLSGSVGRCGLLWIGGQYYPTPDAFSREAQLQGVSRRITAVPKGFQVGETWVLLAHREAIRHFDGSTSPGVFRAFIPQRIEYVVKPDDPPDKLQRLADRGITLVKVVPTSPLFKGAEDGAQD